MFTIVNPHLQIITEHCNGVLYNAGSWQRLQASLQSNQTGYYAHLSCYYYQ